MATFLLEIGTEELPADFARLALPQLEALVRQTLAEERLPSGALQVTSTPRRLAVLVEGLPQHQADRHEEHKGPPAAQAFKDGVATQAAIGFARRCGVDPSALEIRDTPKGPFVFARSTLLGRATSAVLAEAIPIWLQALQGRRFMRWGVGESRFSRPVRWLVALLDQQVIPVTLAGTDPEVTSGRITRGHRLDPGRHPLAAATDYQATLRTLGVLVDRQERGELIRSAIEQGAATRQASPDLPEDLFEELVDLVEAPLLIEGQIETRFLALPPEVLATVMRAHQRYVPLKLRQAEQDPLALSAEATLLPSFLCISNGREESSATIRRGNERVLKARLADAEFFLGVDRACPSQERLQQLERVQFAEGLGSLRQRSERLSWMAEHLIATLPLASAAASAAARAASLCKHDLVSQMVGEFPELQGSMGGKYLLAEGENRATALAVAEHYLPRGAGDALPVSEAGAVVAIADRLELLLSIFAKGERPSGSSDPYALRRAGNGLLQILWQRGWVLDLDALLAQAAQQWQAWLPALSIEASALSSDLGEFLRQRVASLLEEQGIAIDLVQAVAGESLPIQRLLQDPGDARERATLLARLRQQGQLTAVQAVVTRATRLAAQSELGVDILSADALIDRSLFASPSEAGMLAVIQTLEPITQRPDQGRYADLAAALAAGAEALAAFFDGEQSVMVMCDQLEVRRNRLNLLALLRNQASVLADFSRIQG